MFVSKLQRQQMSARSHLAPLWGRLIKKKKKKHRTTQNDGALKRIPPRITNMHSFLLLWLFVMRGDVFCAHVSEKRSRTEACSLSVQDRGENPAICVRVCEEIPPAASSIMASRRHSNCSVIVKGSSRLCLAQLSVYLSGWRSFHRCPAPPRPPPGCLKLLNTFCSFFTSADVEETFPKEKSFNS